MGRSTDLTHYGPEYEQLLLRAEEGLHDKDEYTVQFASNNVATSIRTRTYGYFKALRESGKRPDLCAISTGLSMRVAGSALVFFRRENAADAVALRNALGLPDGFAEGGGNVGMVVAPQSGLSSHLQKLDEIRSRKNNAK